MPRRRGAVVIGVNKTGNLQPLESAADGAEAFGNWLTSEGFEVKVITDKAGKVKAQEIQSAVESFVQPGNFDQLVIYFSGHGYWKNDAELWLLSDAPLDANAAVSWVETAEFAKDCGIPSVVMISDACRSIPATPKDLRVRGSIIFPNDDVARSRAKVDKFMAAVVGAPAFEIPIDGKKQSVFTHCLLGAFAEPDAELIKVVNEDGVAISVIPNRRLGRFLQRCMTRKMAVYGVQYNPRPDAEVLSDEDIYIGKARPPTVMVEEAVEAPRRKPELPVIQLRDVAEAAISRAMDKQDGPSGSKARVLEQMSRESGFEAAIEQARSVAEITHFETETGFAVLGTAIEAAAISNGGHADVVQPGNGRDPGVVRLHMRKQAHSLVLRFRGGHTTVLAALQGYIGHVLVEHQRVVNVSYIPSVNSQRWGDYQPRRERLDKLRAAVAAAVRLGVFRLDEKEEAWKLAERIRVFKGLDPSLGLFAAYAYSDADRREDVLSVLRYMRDDLTADLFDVRLLARSINSIDLREERIVPFCPMLTQGWNFLRARKVELPELLYDAQDELEPALWTTFKPERGRLIFDAFTEGQLR